MANSGFICSDMIISRAGNSREIGNERTSGVSFRSPGFENPSLHSWGDESWREAAYDTTNDFFGQPEKTSNEAMVSAFQERLKTVAGFKHVPEPIPMRNTTNAVVYYLFFASHKPVAQKIVEDIFGKYRDRQGNR